MANFDVYQVVDTSVFQGQKCLNVYFYQVQDIASLHNAAEVSTAYQDQVLSLVKTMQESDVLHTEIRVTNLFDPSDTHVDAISVPGVGAYGSDVLPIFTAASFREIGDNGAVRNGHKRYAGLDEGIQQNGVVTNGTWLTQAGQVADQLATPLTVGIINAFIPVIVKRLLVGGNYVLPDALVDTVVSQIVDAVFDVVLTSQTSRKIGNGA